MTFKPDEMQKQVEKIDYRVDLAITAKVTHVVKRLDRTKTDINIQEHRDEILSNANV